ncbi:hypothetical protein GWI33_018846 [Rhynchophorus ferrugineus]|uniref:Uncharacterized protein n=1 Tax=Rhynchophorus ferrugineus TaxID=354439 RepID=A0A834M4S1_RHYFE|nr:hypothetical protein GWI33_018846 [Rhynchophorus ferrugineus]
MSEIVQTEQSFEQPLPVPSTILNKSCLKDIEEKCKEELIKFDQYISNIQELKLNWIRMRECEKLKNEKAIACNTSQPRHSKGRIFYVDNDLC